MAREKRRKLQNINVYKGSLVKNEQRDPREAIIVDPSEIESENGDLSEQMDDISGDELETPLKEDESLYQDIEIDSEKEIKKKKDKPLKKQKEKKPKREKKSPEWVKKIRRFIKERPDVKRLGILLLALVAAIGVGVVASRLTEEYTTYQVINETDISDATWVEYVDYLDNMIRYSKDGATYINKKGEVVWTQSYALKSPLVAVRQSYVVLADNQGNEVYLFDESGLINSYDMPYKIISVDVAAQGEFAVTMEGDGESFINLYDKNGGEIATVRTTIANNGYPLDVCLSEDGKKVFTSYLTVDGASVINNLCAYNFGSVGQNENADRLVGTFSLAETDTIVPEVEFVDNNTVCAIGDNEILIFAMKEKPKLKTTLKLEQEALSVFYNRGNVGYIIDNPNDDAEMPYMMKVFSMSGHQVLKRTFDISYNQVKMSDGEVLLLGDTDCLIYDMTGRVKFKYAFGENIDNIVKTSRPREYILIMDNKTSLIRLSNRESKRESE